MSSRIVKVTLGLLITALLASCATVQEESIAQKTYVPVRTVVPVVLTAPCKAPVLKGNTIGELVRHIVDLRGSIDECSNRMLTIDRSIDEYDRRYSRDTEISGDVNTK